MEQELEIPLTGGRITKGVVRVGDTVRRPVGPHSPFVHRLLRHLEDVGYDLAHQLYGAVGDRPADAVGVGDLRRY